MLRAKAVTEVLKQLLGDSCDVAMCVSVAPPARARRAAGPGACAHTRSSSPRRRLTTGTGGVLASATSATVPAGLDRRIAALGAAVWGEYERAADGPALLGSPLDTLLLELEEARLALAPVGPNCLLFLAASTPAAATAAAWGLVRWRVATARALLAPRLAGLGDADPGAPGAGPTASSGASASGGRASVPSSGSGAPRYLSDAAASAADEAGDAGDGEADGGGGPAAYDDGALGVPVPGADPWAEEG
jgi:hypothetical protein